MRQRTRFLGVAFSFIQSLLRYDCRDQQQNITGWWKYQIFYGLFIFFQKN